MVDQKQGARLRIRFSSRTGTVPVHVVRRYCRFMKRQKDGGQSQLTVGEKTWLCELPKLPPILVPPPAAQIRPCIKAAP